MNDGRRFTLFFAPNSRGTGSLILCEELSADYELHVINMKIKEQRSAAYLAINPMGKVPAVLHNGALITEQVAVYLYLADLYPEAHLAPPIGDPLRGPYLRWVAFYGSCFEPAVVDRALKRDPAPPAMCPYGDYDTMFSAFTEQLGRGDYILGDRFTAADVLWGTALGWMVAFKLVPDLPVIAAYVERTAARPAARRARAKEAEIALAQSA